jgi:hypothetical protein
MPGAALRGARGTLRAHPARRPISALPTALLAYRSGDMLAAQVRRQAGPFSSPPGGEAARSVGGVAGALTSGADRAIFGRTSGAGH